MSIPQGSGQINMSSHLARLSIRDDLITTMQMQHKMERDQDRAKIASLEQYIETIHVEFARNKKLMQMLIDKVEAD